MYELYAGRKPFSSDYETLEYAKSGSELKFFLSGANEISLDPFVEWIQDMLSVSPQERPSAKMLKIIVESMRRSTTTHSPAMGDHIASIPNQGSVRNDQSGLHFPNPLITSGFGICAEHAICQSDRSRDQETPDNRYWSYIFPLKVIVELSLADQNASYKAADAFVEHSVGSRQDGSSDIFQIVRKWERFCNDTTVLNEYVKAYFTNVHPLIPFLHKEAFLKLYRRYGLKALANNIETIPDGATLDGRAVGLICAVLALGSLSLVETQKKLEEDPDQSAPELPHFGEALGFYGICVRLLAYTHDTIETMMTHLLMVWGRCLRILLMRNRVYSQFKLHM